MKPFLRLSLWTQVVIVAIVPTLFLVAAMGGLDVISVGKRTLQIEGVLAQHPEAAASARAILERIRGAPRAIPAVVSACLLAIVALAALVARPLALRLAALTAAAERMAAGRLEEPILAPGRTELDDLARALDAMRLELGSLLEHKAKNAVRAQSVAVTALLQQMALPVSRMQVGTLSLHAEYWPATQASGDWWWHETYEDGSLLVVLGDVTGHGTAAALVTAAVAAAFRALREQRPDESVPSLLASLNALLYETCAEVHTMALCAVLIEPQHDRVSLHSAGAPSVLVRDAHGAVTSVSAPGSPLGSSDFTTGLASAAFGPGSTLLAFSDGVSEMLLPDGRDLGVRRLRKLLTSYPNACDFARELARLAPEVEQPDDRTFVLVTRRE